MRRTDRNMQFLRMFDPQMAKKEETRRKRTSPEHNLQVRCVVYFRLQYPNEMIFAIPNGGQRNVIVAKRLKDEGVVKGIPDLCIPYPSRGFHGLYIEMKAGKRGKVSPEQAQVMNKLNSLGYYCAVCRTFDEFKEEVDRYMKKEEPTGLVISD